MRYATNGGLSLCPRPWLWHHLHESFRRADASPPFPIITLHYLQWMPHSIHILIESGIVLASIAAVLLNLIFNGAKGDTEAVVRATKQAEAH